MQGQIVELFENVLDADNSDEPTSKRMVDYYQRSGQDGISILSAADWV